MVRDEPRNGSYTQNVGTHTEKMELGQKCKINFDDRVYKVIDTRIKKIDKSTAEKQDVTIEHFVDLEEIENPDNQKMNVSTTKVYPI